LQDPDPELEVMDPDPAPELDLNLAKNNRFDTSNYDIKKYINLIFLLKRIL
jgi:hypothetical protein